ncbi:hypothetical protein BKI52_34540 [marine bacterium AO1-C]|nr:hypothetical protein BKI52_34540 [marine bacterium AO1-C]
MRILSLMCALVFIGFCAQAQTKAVTETGDEVLLFDDGTWKYVKDSVYVKKEISMNPKKFVKSASATFLLKSKKANTGVWLNPKKWSFEKSVTNEAAEYNLNLRGGDLYGLMINERLSVPLETLKLVAVENAKRVATNFKLLKEEYRMVNGKKVIFLEMEGVLQGLKFVYNGYYYSSKKGSTQLLVYTSRELYKEYQNDIAEFLNGLVELE